MPPLSALKTPLRDGDLERPDDEAYANAFFLNATSNRAPQIVDLDRREIDDESEVYSGVYARVSLNFYAFSVNGNRGIAAGLNNIQKVRDGEPLGGVSAAQDFAGEFSEEADEDMEDLREMRLVADRLLALFPAEVIARLTPVPDLEGVGLWGSVLEGSLVP